MAVKPVVSGHATSGDWTQLLAGLASILVAGFAGPEPASRLRDRPDIFLLRIEDVFTPDAEPPLVAGEPPE